MNLLTKRWNSFKGARQQEFRNVSSHLQWPLYAGFFLEKLLEGRAK